LLLEGADGSTELAAVSDNEEVFVYSRAFANTYVTSFVKIGEETYNLTPDAAKVHIASDPVFTDDNTIHFVTNYDSEYNYVAKYEIGSKQFSRVVEIEGESVESLKWHKDSGTFYIATEKGVSDSLYRFGAENENPEKLEIPVAIIDKLQVAKSGALYLLGR